MNLRMQNRWRALVLLAGGLSGVAAIGCQTDVGGQTLPSAYYLRDDVQYFPAGPETRLPNQRRAIEEYQARQAVLMEGLEEPPPPPGAAPPAAPPGAFPPP